MLPVVRRAAAFAAIAKVSSLALFKLSWNLRPLVILEGYPSGHRSSRQFCSHKESINWSGSSLEEVYETALLYFNANNIPDAEISARILACDVGKIGYRVSDFNKNLDFRLNETQLEQLKGYCNQRANRVPLQYIIGNWDFYGFTVLCKAPVLIPRPETEELVDRILKSKKLKVIRQPQILDVGTGSGVIGIALLTELKTATCDAIDINEIAVNLSNENAALVLGSHGKHRFNCQHRSFLDFVSSGEGQGKYDLIVSNPPYIPSDEMEDLDVEVGKFEDHVALHGGKDGLEMIRDIMKHSSALLRPDGPREIWMEVARRHPKMIEQLLRHDESYREVLEFVEGITDLSGNPRFVRLRAR